jgi:hypothetical protein
VWSQAINARGLLFQSSYSSEPIGLGARDTFAQREDVLDFFAPELPVAADACQLDLMNY